MNEREKKTEVNFSYSMSISLNSLIKPDLVTEELARRAAIKERLKEAPNKTLVKRRLFEVDAITQATWDYDEFNKPGKNSVTLMSKMSDTTSLSKIEFIDSVNAASNDDMISFYEDLNDLEYYVGNFNNQNVNEQFEGYILCRLIVFIIYSKVTVLLLYRK